MGKKMLLIEVKEIVEKNMQLKKDLSKLFLETVESILECKDLAIKSVNFGLKDDESLMDNVSQEAPYALIINKATQKEVNVGIRENGDYVVFGNEFDCYQADFFKSLNILDKELKLKVLKYCLSDILSEDGYEMEISVDDEILDRMYKNSIIELIGNFIDFSTGQLNILYTIKINDLKSDGFLRLIYQKIDKSEATHHIAVVNMNDNAFVIMKFITDVLQQAKGSNVGNVYKYAKGQPNLAAQIFTNKK
jgi:hypothetical protein